MKIRLLNNESAMGHVRYHLDLAAGPGCQPAGWLTRGTHSSVGSYPSRWLPCGAHLAVPPSSSRCWSRVGVGPACPSPSRGPTRGHLAGFQAGAAPPHPLPQDGEGQSEPGLGCCGRWPRLPPGLGRGGSGESWKEGGEARKAAGEAGGGARARRGAGLPEFWEKPAAAMGVSGGGEASASKIGAGDGG